jgi:formate dehydrogenase major subunit
MYIMGENPAMSDPDLNHARHALASLEHLVVQDIFLTETAWLADVVLPASAWPEKTGTVSNTDRTVQLGRQALTPPGRRARRPVDHPADGAAPGGDGLWQESNRPGAGYHGVAAVFEEMRQAMHAAIAGITWPAGREGSVTYPCLSADDPGQPIVFTDHFPTADGRVKLVPADIIRPTSGPMPTTPWCSSPAASWSTGTPAA